MSPPGGVCAQVDSDSSQDCKPSPDLVTGFFWFWVYCCLVLVGCALLTHHCGFASDLVSGILLAKALLEHFLFVTGPGSKKALDWLPMGKHS